MDLFSYVASGYTVGDERLTQALFKQVCTSMMFLHSECNKSHLDIKLENIVVDSDYSLKLIDFAYSTDRSDNVCEVLGTERYFAPELAEIYYAKELRKLIPNF